ncbi:hypothetical protein L7F22_022373 [Adiantum nelumboides]|nr:hypothetical protein [Adiantum nelumboides]
MILLRLTPSAFTLFLRSVRSERLTIVNDQGRPLSLPRAAGVLSGADAFACCAALPLANFDYRRGVYDEEGVVPLEADVVATGAISSSLFALVGEEEDVHGRSGNGFRHVMFPPSTITCYFAHSFHYYYWHLAKGKSDMSDQEGPEPGPSTIPVFKKRGSRPRHAVSNQTQAQESTATSGIKQAEDEEDPSDVSLSDLVALHAPRQKPRGIDLDRLNKGQNAKKKKKKKQEDVAAKKQQTEEDRWQEQMQRGGLVTRGMLSEVSGKSTKDKKEGGSDSDDDEDDEDEEERKKASGPRLVKQNNFQGETGTVDVDKHMMAYIEEEMRKRREAAAASNSSTSSSAPTAKPLCRRSSPIRKTSYTRLQKSTGHCSRVQRRPLHWPRPRGHHGGRTQGEENKGAKRRGKGGRSGKEGTVTLSSAMLTSVPEVDLGMAHRLKNIQETEKAKRAMEEARRNRVVHPLEEDDQYAAARFFRHRNTVQTDAEALEAARREAGMLEDYDYDEDEVEEDGLQGKKAMPPSRGGGGAHNEPAKRSNFQMATDDAAVERFKKRQRNQLKK